MAAAVHCVGLSLATGLFATQTLGRSQRRHRGIACVEHRRDWAEPGLGVLLTADQSVGARPRRRARRCRSPSSRSRPTSWKHARMAWVSGDRRSYVGVLGDNTLARLCGDGACAGDGCRDSRRDAAARQGFRSGNEVRSRPVVRQHLVLALSRPLANYHYCHGVCNPSTINSEERCSHRNFNTCSCHFILCS